MCLYPRLIQNPKYTKNKKNGGVIPPVNDKRALYVPIQCNKCMECKQKKAREWSVRLNEEIAQNREGKFVTLTFSNEKYKELWLEIPDNVRGYERDNRIATIAVRRFLERWRKEYGKSVRHWFVTELGHQGTENIHLHGILWTNEHGEKVEKLWQYGFIWRGYATEPKINGWSARLYVNGATVGYITKYVQKKDVEHKHYEPRILTSAGIGRGYTTKPRAEENKYKGADTQDAYRTEKGHKIGMPIYYRNKLYTEEERERLWLHKLDKNTRWIGGTEIKADDHKAYYGLIKHYREKSKKLGYGDDKRNYDEEEYEKRRRELMQWQRIHPPGAPPAGGNSKDILDNSQRDPDT